MTDPEVMLVRIGGDVIRRPVAHVFRFCNDAETDCFEHREPELRPGEQILWKIGDSIPTIIKDT